MDIEASIKFDQNQFLKSNTTPSSKNKKIIYNMLELNNACGCTSTVLCVEDNLYNVVPVKMILQQTYNLTLDRACNGLEGI